MGFFTDAMNKAAPDSGVDTQDTLPTSFKKGLRSGGLAAVGQLAAATAAGAQAVGADELASSMYANSDDYQRQAAAAAPQVTSFEQASKGGLRDFGNYAAGVVGGSLPYAAAGTAAALATGGAGVVPAMLASTAAMTPFETGEVVQRMRANGGEVEPGTALLTGLGSAAAQGVVPGMLGARLRGGLAVTPAKSVMGAAGRELAAIPAEAATEVAGEGIKQLGATGEFDGGQLIEAGIGGAIGGAPFAAAGMAHRTLTQPGLQQTIGNGLGAARDALVNAGKAVQDKAMGPSEDGGYDLGGKAAAAKDFVAEKAGAAQDGIAKMAGTAKSKVFGPEEDGGFDLGTKAKEVWDKTKTTAVDEAEDIASGKTLASFRERIKAAKEGAPLEDIVGQENAARVEKVKTWAAEMMNDAGLTQEKREKLSALVKDIGTDAGQKGIAAMKAAREKAKSGLDSIDALLTKYVKRNDGAEGEAAGVTDAPRTKQSRVEAGLRETLKNIVLPSLEANHPDLTNNPDAVNKLGDGLRRVVAAMAKDGNVDSDTMDYLSNVFGEDTRSVLESVHEATMVGDRKQTDKFFGALNRMADNEARQASRAEVVRNALGVETSPRIVRELVRGIEQFMSPSFARGLSQEQARYRVRQTRAEMRKVFGEKTDEVLEAFAPKVREQSQFDGSGERAAESDEIGADGVDFNDDLNDMGVLAEAVSKKPVLSPGNHRAKFGGESQAEREIREAQSKDERVRARWVDAREYGQLTGKDPGEVPDGYGFVVSERIDSDDKLSGRELNAMRWDTRKQAKDASQHVGKIDLGNGTVLDATKIVRVMQASEPYNAFDETSADHRRARMFMEGIARLQDHFGYAFDVPDSLVIAKKGQHSLTYGEAKAMKASKPTASEKAARADTAEEFERQSKKAEEIRDRELGTEPEPAVAELRANGAYEANPDTDIVTAALEQPNEKALKIEFDLAGRPVDDKGGAQPLVVPRGSAGKVGTLTPNGLRALDSMLSAAEARVGTFKGKTQNNIAQKLAAWGRAWQTALEADPTILNAAQTKQLLGALHPQQRLSNVAELTRQVGAPPKVETEPKADKVAARVDQLVNSEDYSSLNTSAKASAFLKAAKQRLDALSAIPEDDRSEADDLTRFRLKALFAPGSDLSTMLTETDDFRSKPKAEQERMLSEAKALQEGTPDPKAVAAKKAAFLEKARSGDKALIKELAASDDAKGLQRAAQALIDELRDGGQGRAGLGAALDTVNDRLAELVRDPGVAYSMLRIGGSTANAQSAGPAIRSYIDRVLGPKVKLMFSKIPHAGEFRYIKGEELIRISVHSLDPLSVAHHEALHALFSRLEADSGLRKTLQEVANTPRVLNRIRELLAGEPEALAQLSDSEERVAYMYQFWAAGELTIHGPAKSWVEKFYAAVRRVLGMWSNDERALEILKAFHDGQMADPQDMKRVGASLMAQGKNKYVERLREVSKPLTKLADAALSTGSARLRETGVPALSDIADMIKRQNTQPGDDAGYLPAQRNARVKTMNELTSALGEFSKEDLAAAMKALQRGEKPAEKNAKIAARIIRHWLDGMHNYMTEAGVKVGDLGVGKDYFPRVWDVSKLLSKRTEFLALAQKYVDRGEYKGTAEELYYTLVNNQGTEFRGAVPRPGMQHTKERVLAFFEAADAEPFLNKNLFETLNSYAFQATRRAEWTRRFGHDNAKFNQMRNRAEDEGATLDDLDALDKYVASVDGTLGDDLDPRWREAFGAITAYQNIRLLPLSIFSSVVDPLGVAVRGGSLRDAWGAFKRGVREAIPAARGTLQNDYWADLAETMGVVDTAMLQHTVGEMYGHALMGENVRKINDAFFRYNLMEGWNRSMRVGALQAGVKFIEAHASGKASPHSARWMAELGLVPGQIKFKADGSLALSENDGLTANEVQKLHAALNQFVDGAVLRPDAADKPIWMSDPRWAVVAHLKQFVFAFQATILDRVMHEAQFGNYKAPMALAMYVPVMIAADLLKASITPGDPQWDDELDTTVMHGVERAGLFGVGQFQTDLLQNPVSVLGPTIEQLADGLAVAGGRAAFGDFVLRAMPANALYAG